MKGEPRAKKSTRVLAACVLAASVARPSDGDGETRDGQNAAQAAPDPARRPMDGLGTATADWTARRSNAASDRDDLVAMRRLANGPAGPTGL